MHIYNRELPKPYSRRLIEIAVDDLRDLYALRPRDAHPHGDPSWIGVKSVEELDRRVRDGWPELADRMGKMLREVELPEKLLTPELTMRRRRRHADHGNELDIHAVYQGRMDRAWDSVVMEQSPKHVSKLVHIAVNVDANAYVSFDDSLWRGALIMRLYEALTRMGKSVSVTLYDFAVGGFKDGSSSMSSIVVKKYEDDLRPEKLASMVNVGFMRRFMMEHIQRSHPTLAVGYGHGRATDDYRVVPKAVEDDMKAGAAVVVIGHCFSADAADRVLDKFVRQYALGEQIKESSYDNVHIVNREAVV